MPHCFVKSQRLRQSCWRLLALWPKCWKQAMRMQGQSRPWITQFWSSCDKCKWLEWTMEVHSARDVGVKMGWRSHLRWWRCHQKGGPTNPLYVTDVPTCMDSDESFLAQRQKTTLINFGRVSPLHSDHCLTGTSCTPIPPKCLQEQKLPASLPQSAITQTHQCTPPLQKPTHSR